MPVIRNLQSLFNHGEVSRRIGVVARCHNGCSQELLEIFRQQLGLQPHRCLPVVVVEQQDFSAEKIRELIQEACGESDTPFLAPGVWQAIVALVNWPSSISAIQFTRQLVLLANRYAPSILLLEP